MSRSTLVVDPDEQRRKALVGALHKRGVSSVDVSDPFAAMAALPRTAFGCVVAVEGARALSLRGLYQLARRHHPKCALVVVHRAGSDAATIRGVLGLPVDVVSPGMPAHALAQHIEAALLGPPTDVPAFEGAAVAAGPPGDDPTLKNLLASNAPTSEGIGTSEFARELSVPASLRMSAATTGTTPAELVAPRGLTASPRTRSGAQHPVPFPEETAKVDAWQPPPTTGDDAAPPVGSPTIAEAPGLASATSAGAPGSAAATDDDGVAPPASAKDQTGQQDAPDTLAEIQSLAPSALPRSSTDKASTVGLPASISGEGALPAFLEGALEGAGARLLLLLFGQALTGRLRVDGADAGFTVYFYDGDPVWVVDDRGDAGVHSRLVERGDLAADLEVERVPEGKLLTMLVQRGLLSQGALRAFMQDRVRRAVLEICAAGAGTYRFAEDSRFKGTAPIVRVNPFGLVLEGLRLRMPPADLLAHAARIEGQRVRPLAGLDAVSPKLAAFVGGHLLNDVITGELSARAVTERIAFDAYTGALILMALSDAALVAIEPF